MLLCNYAGGYQYGTTCRLVARICSEDDHFRVAASTRCGPQSQPESSFSGKGGTVTISDSDSEESDEEDDETDEAIMKLLC